MSGKSKSMQWPAGMTAAQLIALLKTVPPSTEVMVETEVPHKPAQRMFTHKDGIAGIGRNQVLISFSP